MAGASTNVHIDDAALQSYFKRLLEQSDDLTDVFADIGEHMIESTKQRFEDQVDPDGQKWAKLSDLTLSRKEKNADKIMIESGDLMESMVPLASAEELIFGTNKIYGAMHQFGGTTSPQSMFPGAAIPARPFLGVSNDDITAISDFLVIRLLD